MVSQLVPLQSTHTGILSFVASLKFNSVFCVYLKERVAEQQVWFEIPAVVTYPC